jgi:large subunit ribosomal protein L7/L12
MAVTKEQIIEAIDSMSVMDLNELVKTLQEKYGVSAAAPVAAAMPGPIADAPVVEEKTSFDVVLAAAGDNRLQVIKIVREITQLGLKEAKDLVEGAPQPVAQGVTKEEADQIKAKLEETGAKVEIK